MNNRAFYPTQVVLGMSVTFAPPSLNSLIELLIPQTKCFIISHTLSHVYIRKFKLDQSSLCKFSNKYRVLPSTPDVVCPLKWKHFYSRWLLIDLSLLAITFLSFGKWQTDPVKRNRSSSIGAPHSFSPRVKTQQTKHMTQNHDSDLANI